MGYRTTLGLQNKALERDPILACSEATSDASSLLRVCAASRTWVGLRAKQILPSAYMRLSAAQRLQLMMLTAS